MEHNRKIRACKLLRNGGATRDRTDDLIVANVVEPNLEIRTCKSLRNGGASRDRTDDLIVANDVVLRYSALIPQDLQTKHPLRTAIYWNTIGT